jgi:SAM-dependent methyltransferase
MGLKLQRKKKRNFKLSLAYRLGKLIPVSSEKKLKLFLDLSWIFSRLAHEQIFNTNLTPDEPGIDLFSSFINTDSSVLDIGCGKGHMITRIIHKTKNIVGVDYDKLSIEAARKCISEPEVTLLHDDVFNYLKKNPGVKFDYVILSHVLEHIDEPQIFLNSIIERARYFYIEVPDFEASHLNLYRQLVGTDLIYTDADHVSEFDRKELEKIISECGLQVIHSQFRCGVMSYWCETR